MEEKTTSFEEIYDRFFGKITDDIWFLADWTKEDTEKDLLNIFIDAIPGFEFPRFPLYNYDLSSQLYNCLLTSEEINIIAILMYNTWLLRQVASIENTRQKYSGAESLPTYKVIYKLNFRKKLEP